MRIEGLYLKNFNHIYTGLGIYEVRLDFSNNDKVVNVIIGKMGSCKTVILGHLQPFASFGTLDIRNQDDIIIPEMDGEKKIIYLQGKDKYHITHIYTWNKNTHNVKSYIEKNGVELNPNGNQGSFKLVVSNELGIEPDYLKLLRLGTNVSNIINMKSTERKSFVASLMQDAEVYLLLFKKLTEDMRTLNTQTSILTNKLNHIGANKENVLRDEYEDNLEEIQKLTKLKDERTQALFSLKAQIQSLLDGEDLNTYKSYYINLQNITHDKKVEYHNLKQKLKQYESAPSIIDISKIIGGLDTEITTNNEKLNSLEEKHKLLGNNLNVLLDGYKISKNKQHIQELQNMYNELALQAEVDRKELSKFDCDYSVAFLTNLLGDLNMINIQIEEISQYDKKMISKVFNSDSSIISWSKKQLEFIIIKKIKLQKSINNIKFSEKYEAPSTLYLPPMCPTESCPYYKTHPYNIQKNLNLSGVDEQLIVLQSQIDQLDVESYQYSDYPYIYTKITNLKMLWKKIYPILYKLDVIRTNSLLQVLINLEARKWYNYDKIINIIELCEKRDRHNEMIDSLNKMKSELASYKLYEDTSIDEKIEMIKSEMDDVVMEITLIEESTKKATSKITEYNQLYLELTELSLYEKKFKDLEFEITNNEKALITYQKNLDIISTNEETFRHQNVEVVELSNKLKTLIGKNEEIKATLNDIVYTKKEFDNIFEEKEILKDILDAVSSKQGIPLKMVKIFLTNSKDVLNELISDVFDDSLEILDFDISEEEFLIPYSINNTIVKDIERASQGQRAVMSLALSFALIREVLSQYNIMLLDEMDGPLYKNDRARFISIIFKQLKAINAEQVFLISHNNTFDGYPVNIIMTTDEIVDKTPYNTIMKVYS